MKTMASVSPERLTMLNRGEVEAKHLVEKLSIDQTLLLSAVFPDLKKHTIPASLGFTKRLPAAAKIIYEHHGYKAFNTLKNHTSDTVRGWACFLLMLEKHPLNKSLKLMLPLANDHHFAVREWAWLALRPQLIEHLEEGLALLQPLSLDTAENIRRFASEVSRPRGVWTQHIQALRSQPWKALPILEPLKQDPSRYVQNSVANWLNDASKDHPLWVQELTIKWLENSASPETRYICKRALRSIKKKK